MSAPGRALHQSRKFFLRQSGRPHMAQSFGVYPGLSMQAAYAPPNRRCPMILSAIAEKLKRRSKGDFKGRHFEPTLILQAVSWYLRYPLSYRDSEELFRERGLEVDHSTLNRWVLADAPLIERRLRVFRKPHCGSIRVDETSYEDCCVKSVLFSADRHRPVPSRVGILGCRGGAPCGEGVPSPTSYPAGQRPRHDPLFGSEELRGERRHSTSAALSDSPRLVTATAPSAPPGQSRPAVLARCVYLRARVRRRPVPLPPCRCKRLSVRPASAPSLAARRRPECIARARSGAFAPGPRS